MSFRDDLDDLETAEDFLNYFNVSYDQRVVNVNRLHILQRFSTYLEDYPEHDRLAEEASYGLHKELLIQAYEDFVTSDAVSEKVFKVHQEQSAKFQKSFVSVNDIAVPAEG